jgi:chemotaxis protein methyltransferase CheR
VLPALRAARANSRTLSIWCAASSTGQEPYTLAMTLAEALPDLNEWKVSFVASDLSPAVLKRAREGRYTQLEINRGLPAAMLVRYFEKQGPEWQVKERLRRMIDFREVNLLRAWPTMPPLDVVFMRNVLIYFDAPTKTEIFGRLSRAMRPDGYLFLGGAETTLNLDDSYERAPVDKASCYRLKSAATAVAA